MRIEYLREFVVFAKHMNFSVASKELMMTQPGLSNHIKAIEDELGMPLVNRKAPVRLTDAGRIFLGGIQRVLFEWDDVVGKTRSSSGPTTIKVQGSLPENDIINESVYEHFAPVTVDVDLCGSVLGNVREGEIDLAILQVDATKELQKEIEKDPNQELLYVGEDSLLLAMERDNPLAKKPFLTKDDLQSTDIVIFSGAFFDSWKTVISELVGEDVSLRFRLDPLRNSRDIGSIDLMGSVYICQSGLMRQHFKNRDDIVIFEEVDGEEIRCDTYLLYDKRNKRATEFVDSLGQ